MDKTDWRTYIPRAIENISYPTECGGAMQITICFLNELNIVQHA